MQQKILLEVWRVCAVGGNPAHVQYGGTESKLEWLQITLAKINIISEYQYIIGLYCKTAIVIVLFFCLNKNYIGRCCNCNSSINQ